jgi:hypothetical protein
LARAKAKTAKEGTKGPPFKRPERGKKRQTGGENAGGYKQTKYLSTKRECGNVKLELCEEEGREGPHVRRRLHWTIIKHVMSNMNFSAPRRKL